MPLFRICTANRRQRMMVMADSLEDLLQKGSTSFDSSTKFSTVVTEKDGCIIPETAILLEVSGELLMLLNPDNNESWTAQDAGNPVSPTMVPNDSNVPQLGEHLLATNQSSQLDVHEPSLEDSMPPTVKVPIPALSTYVEDCLKKGNILACFSNLIGECAHFYLNKCPISSTAQYQEVGRQMYMKYPCIKFPRGSEPWTVFCEKLSQKIRNLRYKQQRKSGAGDTCMSPKQQKFAAGLSPDRNSPNVDGSILPEEEFTRNMKEIKKEVDKVSPDSNHIRLLLKESFMNRRQWIAKLPSQAWAPLIDEFPCFEDMEHVIFEYKLMKKSTDLKKEEGNLTKLFKLVANESAQNVKGTDAEKEVLLIRNLEKMTAFDKGRGLKTQSVVTVKENISEDQIDKACESEKLSAPHLIVFLSEEKTLMEAAVLGDQKVIFCRENSIIVGLLYLAIVYYVTDLNYPRVYSQILGVLQNYVIQENFDGATSTKFNKFMLSANKQWPKL